MRPIFELLSNVILEHMSSVVTHSMKSLCDQHQHQVSDLQSGGTLFVAWVFAHCMSAKIMLVSSLAHGRLHQKGIPDTSSARIQLHFQHEAVKPLICCIVKPARHPCLQQYF